MMKKNEENNDALFRKLMKESGTESPDADFTSNLMKMIAPEKESVIAKPAFSKSFVYIFNFIFAVILVLALLSKSTFSFNAPDVDLSATYATAENIIKSLSSPLLLTFLASGWLLYILDRMMKKTWKGT
jgi:hypothetical protein